MAKYIPYKDADYSELATAQEVYDAYVGGRLRIYVSSNGILTEVAPLAFSWRDTESTQQDTAQVQYVKIEFHLDDNFHTIQVGAAPGAEPA